MEQNKGKFTGFSTTFSRFMNFFVPDKEDKSKGIYRYGKNNDLPNILISLIADSGVATRAAKKVAEYIASDGFVDEKASVFKVNEKQTADQLLQEAAVYMAMLNGVAFHISRMGGKINSVKVIPIQCLRKKTNGGFIYNPTYGQLIIDLKKEQHFAEFQPGVLTNEQITSGAFKNGEILYVYGKTPFINYYPYPDWFSQQEDVKTSAEKAKMDYELAVNGFMPSAIITMVGRVDDFTKDDDGKTAVDHLRESLQWFTGRSKDQNGNAGRFKALLHFVESKDDIPDIQTFDAKSILEASNSKRDIIDRAVCRLFGVHPVLLGYSDAAVLGNQQDLANAALELNKVVNPMQRLITEAFTAIWPDLEWTISEYTPIKYVPDALLQDMTQDERRQKFLGLKPLAQNQQTNQQPNNGNAN